MATTRFKSNKNWYTNPILGAPLPFATNQLPLACDVLRHTCFCKSIAPDITNFNLIEKVSLEVIGVWKSITIIPILNIRTIENKLECLLDNFRNLKKYHSDKQEKEALKFKYWKEIFYIGQCKCVLKTSKPTNFDCVCPVDKKIPETNLYLIIDQIDIKNKCMFWGEL